MCGRSTSILLFNLGSSSLTPPSVSTQHTSLNPGGLKVNFTQHAFCAPYKIACKIYIAANDNGANFRTPVGYLTYQFRGQKADIHSTTSSSLSYTRKPAYFTTHLINEYRSISGSSLIHIYDYMYAFKSG